MDSALPFSHLPRLSVYSEAPCLTAKSPLVKHYVCSAVIGCGRWHLLLVIGGRAVVHRRRAVIGSAAPEARQKSPWRCPCDGTREGPGRAGRAVLGGVGDPGGATVPSLLPRPPHGSCPHRHHPGHATEAAVAPPNPPLAPLWLHKARLPHTLCRAQPAQAPQVPQSCHGAAPRMNRTEAMAERDGLAQGCAGFRCRI